MLLPILAMLAASVVVGLPVVLLPAMATDRPALPRAPGTDAASRRSGIGRSGIGPWIGVLADALLVGLVLICVLAALCAWLGSVAAVIGLALWSAAGLGAGVRVIGRRRSAGAAQDLRLPLPELLGWCAVLVTAVLLRLHSVNFIPWLGDMGAYVNWANEYARTGQLDATWPPLFPAFLAIASQVLGAAHTTDALSAVGIVVLVGVARALYLLGASRWVVLVTAAIVAINPHAVWFSSFPASESVSAAFLVALVVALVHLMRGRSWWWLALIGVDFLALGLVRGSGPLLLVPLAVVSLGCLASSAWRSLAVRSWGALTAGLAGAIVSYWYGISRIHEYYVDTQLAGLVPASLMRLLHRYHLVDPVPVTAFLLLLVVLASATATWAVSHFVVNRAGGEQKAWPIVGALLSLLMIGLLVITALTGSGGFATFQRVGLVVMVFAALAPWLDLRVASDPVRTWLVVTLVLAWTVFASLQVHRLGPSDDHGFFLYWDRYYFSEVVPVSFLLTGLAWDHLATASPRIRRVVPVTLEAWSSLGLALVITLLAAAGYGRALRVQTENTYLDGAFPFVEQLASRAPSTSTPVVWSATPGTTYPDYFFPNGWQSIGRPLHVTFGLDVQGLDAPDHFSSDHVLDAASLRSVVACAHGGPVLVFENQGGGPDLASRTSGSGVSLTELGTDVGTMALLPQRFEDPHWRYLTLRVRSWLATGDVPASECTS